MMKWPIPPVSSEMIIQTIGIAELRRLVAQHGHVRCDAFERGRSSSPDPFDWACSHASVVAASSSSMRRRLWSRERRTSW